MFLSIKERNKRRSTEIDSQSDENLILRPKPVPGFNWTLRVRHRALSSTRRNLMSCVFALQVLHRPQWTESSVPGTTSSVLREGTERKRRRIPWDSCLKLAAARGDGRWALFRHPPALRRPSGMDPRFKPRMTQLRGPSRDSKRRIAFTPSPTRHPGTGAERSAVVSGTHSVTVRRRTPAPVARNAPTSFVIPGRSRSEAEADPGIHASTSRPGEAAGEGCPSCTAAPRRRSGMEPRGE